MFENSQRTELLALGEFGLIDHLSSHFNAKLPSTALGIGDDAALIDIGEEYLAISSDCLIEGVHFDLTYTPLKHLGFKTVVVGISDIIAMNIKPQQVLINVALSNRFSLEAIEELYEGIRLACEKYNVDLIGGDTTTSRAGLMLNITATGIGPKNHVVKRSGVQNTDLLVVTGDVGGAYMGLQILEREKRVFLEHNAMQPDLEPFDYIVGRQLKPEARIDILEILKDLNIKPTSMIDISDGIASEIHQLGKASNVGFDVYEEKIPIDTQTIDTAVSFDLNPSIVALNGGEDYELLMTIPIEYFEQIKSHPDFTIIGHATEFPMTFKLNTRAGNAFDIQAQGWQHINKENK
jgi:thiamine-monophosphate kinase